MRNFRSAIRAAAFVAITLLPRMAAACPTCKESLHDNGAATGYAISILFMMSMPMIISAFWFVAIWRLRKGIAPSKNQSLAVSDAASNFAE